MSKIVSLLGVLIVMSLVGCNNSSCGDAYHDAVVWCNCNDPDNPDCYAKAADDYLACIDGCTDCGNSCGDQFYNCNCDCDNNPYPGCYDDCEAAYQQCSQDSEDSGGSVNWLTWLFGGAWYHNLSNQWTQKALAVLIFEFFEDTFFE